VSARFDPSVHWVCRKPSHRAAPSRGGRGGLITYQGRWAYCDANTDDREHEWSPTGGVTIDQLIDWSKALDPYRSHTVRS
jgi:hypothetical protein